MNKDNVIMIGYYKIPGNMFYNFYIEDTKSYAKEEFKILPEELTTYIDRYKEMYPRHQVCEFVY